MQGDEEQKIAIQIEKEMENDRLVVILTAEEAMVVRKVMQCANQLFTVMENIDGRENKVDGIVRKLRRLEQ